MRTATARASCEPRPEPFTRGLLKSGSFSPAFFVAREVRQRLRRGKSWRSAASCASFCPPGSGQFFRPGAGARSLRTSRLPGYKGCSTTEGVRGKLQPSGESSNLTGEDSTHHFPRLGVGQRPTGLSKGGTCFRFIFISARQNGQKQAWARSSQWPTSPHENAVRESRFFRPARQTLGEAVLNLPQGQCSPATPPDAQRRPCSRRVHED